MEVITSRNNPRIIEAAKLKQKKHRDTSGCFYFEGRKLLLEAIDAKAPVLRVFYTEKNAEFIASLPDSFEKIAVSESVYEKLTDENSPSGLFCVISHLDRIKFLRKIYKDEEIISPFVASSVRDPGNLGTIIRNANALGVGELILSADCADVYNPKTVRAAMGALFRMRIYVVEDELTLPRSLAEHGFELYAATLHTNSVSLTDIKDDSRICYAVGNEGHGLSEEFVNGCRGCVTIPMSEGAESLNVSLAATVLMWEKFRKTNQR